MFKENFVRLCNQKGIAPTAVCVAIGLQKSAFSNWGESSVPRQSTLIKIADYFNITVDELLGEQTKKEPAAESDGLLKEAVDLMSKLSPEDQQQAMKYLEFLHKSSSDNQ